MFLASVVVSAFGCQGDQPRTVERDARPIDARILYDGFRIPHIFAADDRGALWALGYQQARDFPVATLSNLWSATGRYAHVAGPSVLERDARIRQFGIDARAADQEAGDAALAPDVRVLLDAFVEGVNAGRRWWLEEAGALDALIGDGERPALFFDPVPPWLDPLFAKEDSGARLRHLMRSEVTLQHVLSLGLATNGGPEFVGGGYTTRTNIWTVRNSERSASTVTMVDSHQPIKRSGARAYFVQVEGNSYRVTGYSYPGFPCVTLGFNDEIAFAQQTLPAVPDRVAALGPSEFRFPGQAPVHSAAWSARLTPSGEPSIRVGEQEVALLEDIVTLQYWDLERDRLVDDPRGARHFYRVPASNSALAELGLEYPVVQPSGGVAIDASAGEIRFEGRSFLAGPSPWEYWIGVGRARRMAGEPTEKDPSTSLEQLLEEHMLCFGRGQALIASSAGGELEYLSMGLVPIPGAGALDQIPSAVLDGNDPEQRWRGFHASDELPRIVDRGGYREAPEIWIQDNGSPHVLRSAPFDGTPFVGREYVLDPEAWKSLRHDRARELLTKAASDGVVSLDEITWCALDVQDVWARRTWPYIEQVGGASATPEGVRRFVKWLARVRWENDAGKPGDTEFLAHPMSQATVFMTLLRDGFERRLLALPRLQRDELGFAFDALFALPAPKAFGNGSAWARVRGVLMTALDDVANLHRASIEKTNGRLVNRDVLHGYVPAGPIWSQVLDSTADPEWGEDAVSVPARWGLTNLYVLTPHARLGLRGRNLDRSLMTLFTPEEFTDTPFYGAQTSVVLPMGGVRDSIFQVHANSVRWNQEALHPKSDGLLYLLPLDFGSQILYAVEHRPGEKPRARFLASLGSTEITRALPQAGVEVGDHVRNVADFARGRWNDLCMDEEELTRSAIRVVDVRIP